MADIKPFCGYRYNLKNPDELGDFVSPPYDMLDSAFIDSLHEKSPYNVIRIIQNRRLDSDLENRSRHVRAANLMNTWIMENRIVHDREPGVYVYRQTFPADAFGKTQVVRTGITVLVKLVDFSEKIVLPHENTLSGPKVDRYELVEATKAHTELIFGLVSDPDKKAYNIITRAADSPVIGRFTDFRGVVHELIRTCDSDIIKEAQEIVKNRTILIADGHHRYETSLKYARDTKNPSAQYVMMTLVSQADPGLVIKPFHRLVKKVSLSEKFKSADDLAAFFKMTDFKEASKSAVSDFLGGKGNSDMLFADSATQRIFGLEINENGRRFLLENSGGMSKEWNLMSVSKINRLCVEGLMGQPSNGTVLHDVFEYMDNPDAALTSALDVSSFTGCFFIRPLSIGTVHDIVAAGERMPQKSTNFFPKLFSGLVFNRMDG